MNLNESLNLHIRFYTSHSGIQNMWIEKDGSDCMRYEVNSIEDAKNSFEQYLTQIADKNTHAFEIKC